MTRSTSGLLQTGLLVLETLCAAPAGLGVTELAKEIKADKGNLHRLLSVLRETGYVEQDEASRRYKATVQIVILAGSMLRSLNLVEVARPVMRELCESTGETIHLARRTPRGGVYIAQERPFNRLSVETELGSPVPIHCTSTGKALYAGSTRTDLESLLDLPLERHTYRTHQTVESLLADLEETRRRGYSVDDEELNVGIRCLAAPVFDIHGATVASLGLSGPAQRITLERFAELGAEVRAAADKVTYGLGGSQSQISSTPEQETSEEKTEDVEGTSNYQKERPAGAREE